jgi:hypothetical protein
MDQTAASTDEAFTRIANLAGASTEQIKSVQLAYVSGQLADLEALNKELDAATVKISAQAAAITAALAHPQGLSREKARELHDSFNQTIDDQKHIEQQYRDSAAATDEYVKKLNGMGLSVAQLNVFLKNLATTGNAGIFSPEQVAKLKDAAKDVDAMNTALILNATEAVRAQEADKNMADAQQAAMAAATIAMGDLTDAEKKAVDSVTKELRQVERAS